MGAVGYCPVRAAHLVLRGPGDGRSGLLLHGGGGWGGGRVGGHTIITLGENKPRAEITLLKGTKRQHSGQMSQNIRN